MGEEERGTMTGHNHLQDSRPPKVSILLPNLNTRPFLEERMQTILDQTLTDWELIIVDNYSDDGAWEYFQECARKDVRIRISQAPREGMYANWNNCIRLARGEYVYIATSDDTMTPDCLEKMVSALDKYRDCDLCHCCLRVIDEYGSEIEHWWLKLPTQRFYGDMVFKPHIRKAPLDGLLHTCLSNVYHSITQLLIRRTVFEKWGLFKTKWGSRGDFEWEMRISLVCNTFHIPEFLATWRIHPSQATTYNNALSEYKDMIEMIFEAVGFHLKNGFRLCRRLDLKYLIQFYEKQAMILERKKSDMLRHRIQLLWDRVCEWTYKTRYRLARKLGSKERCYNAITRYALKMLKNHGLSFETFVSCQRTLDQIEEIINEP